LSSFPTRRSSDLEILFDFECARFYAGVGTAGDQNLVYKVRGFGQLTKTPLEAYLERGPRGVTLIDRHEEAGDRCDDVPRAGNRSGRTSHLSSLVILVAAVAALALFGYSVFNGRSSPDVPPDAVGSDGRATSPIDAAPDDDKPDAAPIDAPPDGMRRPVPTNAPVFDHGPGCAALEPAFRYTGFVDGYISPEAYDQVMCRQSISIQVNDYMSLYV